MNAEKWKREDELEDERKHKEQQQQETKNLSVQWLGGWFSSVSHLTFSSNITSGRKF